MRIDVRTCYLSEQRPDPRTISRHVSWGGPLNLEPLKALPLLWVELFLMKTMMWKHLRNSSWNCITINYSYCFKKGWEKFYLDLFRIFRLYLLFRFILDLIQVILFEIKRTTFSHYCIPVPVGYTENNVRNQLLRRNHWNYFDKICTNLRILGRHWCTINCLGQFWNKSTPILAKKPTTFCK